MLTKHSIDRLNARLDEVGASFDDRATVFGELAALSDRLQTQTYAPREKTQAQVGYLAGLMDLEDEERYWMLETLVGFPLYYSNEPYRGYHPKETPGASSKDSRISCEMMSVLIDHYLTNGEALRIHDILGLESKRSRVAARRAKRLLARAEKAKGKPALLPSGQ